MNLSRILLAAVLTTAALAQPAPSVPEQPDGHRTKAQLVSLLGRYPSNLEIVLANALPFSPTRPTFPPIPPSPAS